MQHMQNLRYIQNPCPRSSVYSELFYSEPFVTIEYLDYWYIQNLNIFKTQDIQNTVSL